MTRQFTRAALAASGLLLLLAGCASTPGDTIVEIEVIRIGDGDGLSVETYDGAEFGYRKGLPCGIDDRLSQCADDNDLLTEQSGARSGDPDDIEHEGEETSEPED